LRKPQPAQSDNPDPEFAKTTGTLVTKTGNPLKIVNYKKHARNCGSIGCAAFFDPAAIRAVDAGQAYSMGSRLAASRLNREELVKFLVT